jgi:hypothetical protein
MTFTAEELERIRQTALQQAIAKKAAERLPLSKAA